MRISVIVPVYNVAAYLPRSIDSILAQTYTDFDVTLVDDGSTDGSGELCDEYARKNEKIRAFHQANGGPSMARNRGIAESSGELLTYIDSDDIVTPDYLQTLMGNMEKYSADVSCASFSFFGDEGTEETLKAAGESGRQERVYAGRDACIALLYERDFYTSTCNLLVRREIAEKYPFPEGRYHEDDMTTFRYLYAADRVVMSSAVLYCYYQRPGSIMHRYGQPVLDELRAADYYTEYFGSLGKDFRKAADHKKYSLIRNTLQEYPELKEKEPELYQKGRQYLREKSFGILTDRFSSAANRRFALKLLAGKGL